MMALNEKLLEILACPQCHGHLRWEEKNGGLICDNCKLLYEIKNDIPVMLIEEAKKLGDIS
jgi:uncharacterized protein